MQILINYEATLSKGFLFLVPRLRRKLWGLDLSYFFPPEAPRTGYLVSGELDGVELGLAFAALFRSGWRLNESRLERFLALSLPIKSLHASYAIDPGGWEGDHLDLCRESEQTRQGLLAQIRLAKRIVPVKPLLVVHPGWVLGDREGSKKAFVKNIRASLSLLEEEGVTLVVENTLPLENPATAKLCDDPSVLAEIMEAIDHPRVGVCFDFGHANVFASQAGIENGDFSFQRQMVRLLGAKIYHAHLHYNRRHRKEAVQKHIFTTGSDMHLPLTRMPKEETESFARFVVDLCAASAIEEQGSLVLELKPEHILRLWSNPDGSSPHEALSSARMLKIQPR